MLSLEPFFRLLAPWNCLCCGAESGLLCDACAHLLPVASGRCYRCLSDCDGAICGRCIKYTSLDDAWACYDYSGITQNLLHNFKFERARHAANLLAGLMVRRLPQLPANTLVVPLPTATSRARQRGYDQAEELAKIIARHAKLPNVRLLARQGQSRQLGASRVQRHQQLSSAWRVRAPNIIKGANILLIDDVLTTGATIESAANILKLAGAQSIQAATFAQKL